MRFFSAIMAVAVLLSQSAAATANDLNFGTTSRSAIAPSGLPSGGVPINVGGRIQIIGAGAAVTPAQAMALQQVLSSGTQSLILGQLGNAVGNLTNAGSIYALSTNAAISNATMMATNINNMAGGLLSTVLPAGGIAGFGNAISNLSLSLTAAENIVNSGTISSAADLTLTAGGRITNSGNAILSAVNNVNIASGNVTNAGLVTAGNNINVGSSDLQQLNVLNTGGMMSAANAINFTIADSIKSASMTVTGGTLQSNALNLNAGIGNAVLNVASANGTLNVTAGSGTFGTGSDLALGNVNISGDPTFFSSTNLTVQADLLFDEAITLLAGGDINLNGHLIQSRNLGTQGSNITIIAGINLTPLGGAVGDVNAQPGTQITTGTSVKGSGASGTGGSITCGSCTINASSTGAGQNGGNVFIAAYSNSLGAGGNIDLSAGAIDTSAPGKSGNVTVIGGGNILINNINMFGGSLESKPSLVVQTSNPTGSITAAGNGAVTGTLKPASQLSTTAGITTSANSEIETGGGSILLKAGDDIRISTGSKLSSSEYVPPLGSPTVFGRSAGNISISAGGDFFIEAGGLVLANGIEGLAGSDGVAAGASGGSGGNGGNGGTITVTLGGGVDLSDGAQAAVLVGQGV